MESLALMASLIVGGLATAGSALGLWFGRSIAKRNFQMTLLSLSAAAVFLVGIAVLMPPGVLLFPAVGFAMVAVYGFVSK